MYNPIGNAEFRKLLEDGIFAECAVMDTMNNYMQPSDLGYNKSEWYIDDEVWADSPYDLIATLMEDGENDASATVEVKQANNDGRYTDWQSGRMTFFAECIQTGTNTYPEYLVVPPSVVAYYNVAANFCYFYDGHKFAQAVKDRFHTKFPIARGTAEGIKFDCESAEFGFVTKKLAMHPKAELQKKYAKHIQERMEDFGTKKPNAFKKCDGLEDLV